ncbi:homoserine dehydrogenase [Camelimonas abortus]|uniref:Homoserine dehydrogenase n=1 Tax=Camelimonas abortus TaxID=1017184 RepID=A0ABV7LGX0_9HYPH
MKTPLRIGVAGLGTVGASLLRLLARRRAALAQVSGREIEVVAVSARDRARDRGVDISAFAWFDDPVRLAREADVDCVVELIGGAGGPARATVEAALARGLHVVTANKALLAAHGMDLAAMAERRGVALAFEAAVAGGIPVIKTLRESLVGNEITQVSGILNGTCNYILSRMEQEGLSFEACLADAQRLGYAEADPSFDVDGHDTAHKLAILASLAFGLRIDAEAVRVEGIRSVQPIDIRMAEQLGYRIKLLGVATRTADGVEQRVCPTMVEKSSPLARVMGVTNAVHVDATPLGELTLVGPGAGGDATASSVIADIVDIAQAGSRGPVLAAPAGELRHMKRAPVKDHPGGYYVRVNLLDRPGAAASVASRMAEAGISLESIVQRRSREAAELDPRGRSGAEVPVILITYDTTEEAVRGALQKATADGYVGASPQVIRIERN